MGPSKSNREIIRSTTDLSKELGDEYVLFVGSAVSGVSLPKVPMVSEARCSILESISSKLQRGSDADRLVAQYAKHLARGKYRHILETTKFETFLRWVAKTIGATEMDDLLTVLYECDGNEYGPNQSAIAHLLRQPSCLACLTTNFDNSIELSFPGAQSFRLFAAAFQPPEQGGCSVPLKTSRRRLVQDLYCHRLGALGRETARAVSLCTRSD